MAQVKRVLLLMYKRLLEYFGPQHWWPAETRFEVIVGAILTQNTNWGNVEKAIERMRLAGCLDPAALRDIAEDRLAEFVRPAGYFNIKARRLKNFMHFFYKEYDGNISEMKKEPINILRKKLLSVNGIGPETADSILLYALDKPIFVVDAYTRRLLLRHRIIAADTDYDDIQNVFMSRLPHNVDMFNEYHALIVRLGKDFCKTTPVCEKCPLNKFKR